MANKYAVSVIAPLLVICSSASVFSRKPSIEQRFAASSNSFAAVVTTESPADNTNVPTRLTARVTKVYKGNVQIGAVVSIASSPMLLKIGDTYLFFVGEETQDGSYSAVPVEGITPLLAPPTVEGFGLAAVKSDLVSDVSNASSDGLLIERLHLLINVDSLDETGEAALVRECNGKSNDVRLECLGVLAQARPNHHQYVAQMIADMSMRPTDRPRYPEDLFDSIANRTDPTDLPSLEAVALTSTTQSFRMAALDSIRRLRSRQSIPMLVKMLDASDPALQYRAVISLAEITNADSSYAPSRRTFDKDPTRYLALWKQWAHQQQ